MKLVDLFYYMMYSLQTKYRNKGDAKYSSVLALSASLSFFIMDTIIILGIIYDNRITQIFDKFVKEGGISIWIIMILTAIILFIRYYKYVSVEDIEKKWTVKITKLTMTKIITTLLVYIFPIICFMILCYVKT
jgi:hypothetical protein